MCAARKIVNRRGSSAKERDVRKYCCCVHVWRVGSLCICGKCAMVKVRTSLDTYSIYKGLCPKDLRIRAFSERTSFWRHLEVIYNICTLYTMYFLRFEACLQNERSIRRRCAWSRPRWSQGAKARHRQNPPPIVSCDISGCFRHVHRVRSWES